MAASRIRLIGDSASHRDGAELMVVESETVASHAIGSVTRQQAERLVERGAAEWIEA